MRLSIIIPVYNVEPYIKEALESVFQTDASADDYEVIVVNDGTKDNSMDIVHEYDDRQNLIIYEQENRGLSAARMAGLERAQGDYVWFIDSDDWIVENGVGIVLSLLADRPDSDVLMFPLKRCFDDASRNRVDYHIDKELCVDGKSIVKDYSFPLFSAVRYVFRRSLTDNRYLYFPIGLLHEDEYFGPVLLCLAKQVSVLNDVLYIHPQRDGSIMTTLTIRSSYDCILLHKQLMDFMEHELNSDEWPWFRGHCWSFLRTSFMRSKEKFYGTKDYTNYIRKNGIYVWRQWCARFPNSSMRKRIGEFFIIMMPKTYAWFSRRPRRIRKLFS